MILNSEHRTLNTETSRDQETPNLKYLSIAFLSASAKISSLMDPVFRTFANDALGRIIHSIDPIQHETGMGGQVGRATRNRVRKKDMAQPRKGIRGSHLPGP